MTDFWLGVIVGVTFGTVVSSTAAGLFVRQCRESVYDLGFQHGLLQGENVERIKQHMAYIGERLYKQEGQRDA